MSSVNKGNLGKIFEAEIRKSLVYYKKKENIHFFRVPDYRTISRIVKSEYTGSKRPCDFIVNIFGICCYWELKQTRNKTSFNFSLVKEYQISEMMENKKAGGISYILINRRDNTGVNRVFAIDIEDFISLKQDYEKKGRKSIKWSELEDFPAVKHISRERFFRDNEKSSLEYGWRLDPLILEIYTLQTHNRYSKSENRQLCQKQKKIE